MLRVVKIVFYFSALLIIFLFSLRLMESSCDIYNVFRFDNAYLKPSPYGYIPLLEDPSDFKSSVKSIRGGDFVYVEDWTSAVNGRVVFAKVRSGTMSGYLNQDMLVRTKINIYPLISILLLSFITLYFPIRFYKIFKRGRGLVFGKSKGEIKEVNP